MQNLENERLLAEWTNELVITCSENNSLGVALFSEKGNLLFANGAILSLCNDFNFTSLIHPTFEKLVSFRPVGDMIFSGILTIGKINTINTSIEAKIYRKSDRILIAGGVNVSQMVEQNKVMHFLNQKVTNLQRQLEQEKVSLEFTMQQLKETQSMLIHSEKMNAMGQLVAGVAHEINNPIAYISGNIYSMGSTFDDFRTAFRKYTELIKGSNDTDLHKKSEEIIHQYDIDYLFQDFEEMITSSNKGLSHIKTIVQDLRTFSRHDEATFKNIDLISDLKSTLSLMTPEFKTRNIEYQLVAPEKLFLDCCPAELNQIFLNILINGAQAITSNNGKITIEILDNGEHVQIDITDNGCGIPKEIQTKIFDPFFTTKPIGTGTGLGLSIVHKIITGMHKGTIDFVSEINKGTTFSIVLPKR